MQSLHGSSFPPFPPSAVADFSPSPFWLLCWEQNPFATTIKGTLGALTL